jgi:hypothetical protein
VLPCTLLTRLINPTFVMYMHSSSSASIPVQMCSARLVCCFWVRGLESAISKPNFQINVDFGNH